MLTKQFSTSFSRGVRDRGYSYFASRRVKVLDTDKTSATAEVTGEKRYTVEVFLDRRSSPWSVDAFCTCPYVETHGELCKHIWATFLAIEDREPFRSLPKNTTLFLDDDDKAEAELDSQSSDSEHVAELVRTLGGDAQIPYLQKLAKLGLKVVGLPDAGPVEMPQSKPKKPADTTPPWAKLLRELTSSSYAYQGEELRDNTLLQPVYVLESDSVEERGGFRVSLAHQAMTASGKLGKLKKLSIASADIQRIADPLDRQICLMLVGAGVSEHSYGYYGSFSGDGRPPQSAWNIPDTVRGSLLPLLFQTGRFHWRDEEDLRPLAWDDGGPWELFVAMERPASNQPYAMTTQLRRGEQRRSLFEVEALIPGTPALVIEGGLMSEVEVHGCLSWARAFRKRERVEVRAADRDRLLAELAKVGQVPPVAWPAEWNITDVDGTALKPELHLTMDEDGSSRKNRYAGAAVLFRYGDKSVTPHQLGTVILDPQEGRQIRRDRAKEVGLIARLHELGIERDGYGRDYRVPDRRLPAMLTALLDEGWTVLGNKKLFRTGGAVSLNVTTGIDWFDIDGSLEFGDQHVALPELLAAARRGERFVRLGDGSMGMLPDDWLGQHGALLDLGQAENGHVRFSKTQIGLLDALLAAMPEAKFDAQLAAAREKMQTFSGIKPRHAPAEFVGTLRPYQEHGLAWLNFLKEFGWGGCLADDMGLGKTVQMLALMADRKSRGGGTPSLVIMPKSLVFNWMREARQFAPHLRVVDYTGTARREIETELDQADLIFTTYGTLKRDIESLCQREFHYVVLDEAQAIKNPNSQNAKAARLLKARNRVVMTGTPVENHLGDLWSLFEFLNPGMLGSSAAFKGAFGNGKVTDQQSRQLDFLHRTLRPFILRRTKDQVAPELPQRSEQTIECEMTPKQAAYYKELRDYYRASLLGKVDKEGIAKNKIVVLEALLRLRQAACHPGLIDESKLEVDSAKLEALLPMISELVEEGHKALIFSQFVKMLAIVRDKLDAQGVPYEYLDGQTSDRAARVDHFQTDPKCPLFLISLKAGGVGLNLTAADYVFILDPWWNPAVEAQAIDRTHRIGQTKNIIAYRIVTRDTVESKILDLQNSKRALADAIITQANSLIQNLTRDDLSLLLS